MSVMARGSMIKKTWIFFLMVVFVPGFATALKEQQEDPQPETTVESADRRAFLVVVLGPLGPATVDFLVVSLN
jgi:hypothetical protein